ncbi:hypothetical protein WICMUC_004439 [Wickerhamomyces mucosus]|uniref:Uncharacterized protein n=1 Tax=Wickerhamomyces mucosus TaxID=1378264 RepID=A0A9P8TAY8_9ASCO|nr:hypothetical protein WICMUC_004439 [Wickerhamomyces mucosus]
MFRSSTIKWMTGIMRKRLARKHANTTNSYSNLVHTTKTYDPHNHDKCRRKDLIDNKIQSLFKIIQESNFPPPDELEELSFLLLSSKVDFRSIINYKLLVKDLETKGYFEDKPIWFVYLTRFKILISTCKQETYLMRVSNFFSLTKIINNPQDEEGFDALKKLMLPDLIDTIQQAIQVDDQEYVGPLLSFCFKNFGRLSSENYNTLFHAALINSNEQALHQLWREVSPNLLNTENGLVLQASAKNGEYELLARLLKPDEITESYNISLIVQSFARSLSTKDVFSLLVNLSPLSIQFNSKDFDFIVEKIESELISLSLERKQRIPDKQQLEKKPRKIFIQRIDIFSFFQNNYAQIENDDLKIFFMNLFLKALSNITNTTGVLYGYTLNKEKLDNFETFEILFHCCSKGNDSSLRAFDLFKLTQLENMRLSQRSFEFLLDMSIRNADENEITYYLYHYFQNYETLTDKMRYVLKRTDGSDMIRQLGTRVNPRDIIKIKYNPTFKPKSESIFDLKESQMLERYYQIKS